MSKTAIVSVMFILVGAMVAVARRRSCSLILYIITTTILLICAFLIIIVLKVPAYTPLGMSSSSLLLVCSLQTLQFGCLELSKENRMIA